MKLKEYRGNRVLKQASARLVPWDASKPDCICELLLTERNFYVLEDNYNGTYTEHYVFPVKEILFMGIVYNMPPRQAAQEQAQHMAENAANMASLAMGTLTGTYAVETKNRNIALAYLRIDFYNLAENTPETIFFTDRDRAVEKMIKYWNKKKLLSEGEGYFKIEPLK